MTEFFNKLPTITYNGATARNFMARAKLSPETTKDRTVYYPYTLRSGERMDVVSHKYYDNPDYAWLVYLANEIVDPYYGVYLSDHDFESFIESKYGTVANAQTQILYYTNNWIADDSEISITAYERLIAERRKYYDPMVDQYNQVYGYNRKREDWTVNTNQIVTANATVTGTFTVGEKVVQRYANNLITSNAHVTFANSTNLTVQHVDGVIVEGLTVTGQSSNASANLTAIYTVTNIPTEDLAFWKQVTAYEYEEQLNVQRKEIYLIDNRFKQEAEYQLKKVMSD